MLPEPVCSCTVRWSDYYVVVSHAFELSLQAVRAHFLPLEIMSVCKYGRVYGFSVAAVLGTTIYVYLYSTVSRPYGGRGDFYSCSME